MDENKEKDEALFLDTKKPLFLENEQALFLETGSRHNAGGQTRTRQTESYYGSVVKRLISGYTGEQPDLPPKAVQMRAMKDATISLIAKKRRGEIAKRTWKVYRAALTYGIEEKLKGVEGSNPSTPIKMSDFTKLTQ